ncbi:trypsin-like serine peptidase, partial [Streptomyces rochei]|uniref:trypsin-like serine peptidase n=1 Tax=Streptomyces rochei TaxID=1928 RepID=UPI003702C7F6
MVALAPADDGRPPGAVFGWNRLSARLGKLVIGERVNIVGHPSGRLKEVALRDNTLQVRLDDFLHYRTDTEPGNSGSPVFNDQWEVVALHHSGVPRTDEQGRILRKDGEVWSEGDGNDAVDWMANEGVRISSVLKHLAAAQTGAAGRELLARMGPDSGLGQRGQRPHEAAGPSPFEMPDKPSALAVAESAAVGLKARAGALGGRRHLVFLHGRSQQKKDPATLRRTWTQGLNRGLLRAGRAQVDPEDVSFPYYGDRLAELMSAESLAVEPAGPYGRMLLEAASTAGMPPQAAAEEGFTDTLVGTFQRALGWLAAHSEVDRLTIDAVFQDVARYLADEHVRSSVIDTVAQ